MTIDVRRISNELSNIAIQIDVEGLGRAAQEAANEFAVSSQSTLRSIGQEVNGITSLTQGDLENLGEGLVDASRSIAEVGGTVPGLEDILTQDVSAVASDLNTLTGETVSNGVPNVIISSGAPEALAFALNQVTDVPIENFQSSLTGLTLPAFSGQISNLNNIVNTGIGTNLISAISSSSQDLNNVFGGLNTGNLIFDLVIKTDLSILNVIRNLGIFDDTILKDVLISLSNGSLENATNQLVNVLGEDSRASVEIVLASINATGSNITNQQSATEVLRRGPEASTTANTSTPRRRVLNSPQTGQGSREITSTGFTYVYSAEELISEFRSSTREITTQVTHWTATFIDQDIGSEECHEWHLARGFSGCGYHYIIRRDGRLQRGRPLNISGAHAAGNGFNTRSIGISFAGGYTVASGTPNFERYTGPAFTPSQWQTYDMFLDAFYRVWPGGQSFGHIDVDTAGKIDPGFNVAEYAYEKFGKRNLPRAIALGPASAQEIVATSLA